MPIVLEARQPKVSDNPRNVARAVTETPEAARDHLGPGEPRRAARSRLRVASLDLAVVRVHARHEIGDAGGERRIDLPQLGGELVALGLRPLVGLPASLILLLCLQLAQSLAKLCDGRLHSVAPERGVVHLAAGRRHVRRRQCGVERPLARALGRLAGGHGGGLDLADQRGHVV